MSIFALMQAKTQIMIRILLLSLFSVLLYIPDSSAQLWFQKQKRQKGYKGAPFQAHNSITLGAGSSQYFYSSDDLTYFSNWINANTSFNFGASFTRHFHKKFSYRFSGNFIQIKGDDVSFTKIPTNNTLQNMVFSTSNNIVEIGVKGLYEILGNDEYVLKRSPLKPYISLGISVVSNNPSISRTDGLGYSGGLKSAPKTLNYYLEPTTAIPKPGLSTFSETITNPAEVVPSVGVAIPLHLGLRYKLNDKIDLGFELGYLTNLTPSIFPQIASTNTTKVFNPKLFIPAKRPYTTDHVVTTQFQVIFHIPSPKECPPLPR
jgi:hypothetical protein